MIMKRDVTIELDINEVLADLSKKDIVSLTEELAEEHLGVGELVSIAETMGSYEEILDCLDMGDIISYLNSRGYKVED